MIDSALAYAADVITQLFPDLDSEKRILHPDRRAKVISLVQGIENARAIQLNLPDLVERGPENLWQLQVDMVASTASSAAALADVLVPHIGWSSREPQVFEEPVGRSITEYMNGPGYEVVLVRFRFRY